jgi:hypothetical protein
MSHPLLYDHEGGQQHQGHPEQGEGDRRRPPIGAGLGEAVDEGQQATGHREGARQVVAVPDRAATLGHQWHGGQGGDDGDRHVDQEGPAPRGVLGQSPAEDEADGRATAGDTAVDGEGPGPLLGLGEGHRQQ